MLQTVSSVIVFQYVRLIVFSVLLLSSRWFSFFVIHVLKNERWLEIFEMPDGSVLTLFCILTCEIPSHYINYFKPERLLFFLKCNSLFLRQWSSTVTSAWDARQFAAYNWMFLNAYVSSIYSRNTLSQNSREAVYGQQWEYSTSVLKWYKPSLSERSGLEQAQRNARNQN